METVGLSVWIDDGLLAAAKQAAELAVAALAGVLALYHAAALRTLERDKRRLVEAVGPIAFSNGGLYAERGVHHRQRALFFALIAGIAVALLL